MEDEKQLFERICNDDKNAFMVFFNLYAKKIYQFIFKFIQEKTETEDLTQIVFIKIWEKRATINGVDNINAYIFTIAHRVVLDYFKLTATKNKALTTEDVPEEIYTSDLTADDLVYRHEFEKIYNKALDTLPPKRKMIFTMSRHEGLSNKQISERLGISIKTVESQMTSALTTIKNWLKKADLFRVIIFGLFYFHK